MEGDSNIDVEGIGYEGEDWIHLAQNKAEWQHIMNMLKNFLFQ
jgi:hypothetical protein